MPTTNPTYTVFPLQTLLDVCLESAGKIDGLFDCATLNGIGITDDLTPGQLILGLFPAPEDLSVVALFVGHPPASASTVEQVLPGGIGYMQLHNNFKVS